MKILFVWPIVRFSIWDVAAGYHKQLVKQLGEENVIDYFLDKHSSYHMKALEAVANPEVSQDRALVSKFASESVLTEAVKNKVDLVLIISGKNLHPISLWLLKQVGIPAVVLFTESPYEDDSQIEWFKTTDPDLLVFTNESSSARKYNWIHLPHAYDPDIHKNSTPVDSCDVLFVGSGWQERVDLFESIDWTGIDFRIVGIWPNLDKDSPLHKYMKSALVKNNDLPHLYCGAKINLSPNRSDNSALSFGPRQIELAACGAFQISDYRFEAVNLFEETVPLFTNPKDLEEKIRFYLANDKLRQSFAKESQRRAVRQTFAHRTPILLHHLQSHVAHSRLQKETV